MCQFLLNWNAMVNIAKIAFLMLFSAAGAGCTTTVVRPPADNRVYSFSYTSEGVNRAGVWVMMNSRVIKDSRGRLADRLDWRSGASHEAGGAMRYATVSAERFAAFARDLEISYEPAVDSAGLLLSQAASVVNYSRPQFYIRSKGGSVIDVAVSGRLSADAKQIDLTVEAVQQEGGLVEQQAKWVGSAGIGLTQDYVILEVPPQSEDARGMPERMLVILVPHYFRWTEAKSASELPWGRRAEVEISGERINFSWSPAK